MLNLFTLIEILYNLINLISILINGSNDESVLPISLITKEIKVNLSIQVCCSA